MEALKLGLVLSGGSIRGVAPIGALKASQLIEKLNPTNKKGKTKNELINKFAQY